MSSDAAYKWEALHALGVFGRRVQMGVFGRHHEWVSSDAVGVFGRRVQMEMQKRMEVGVFGRCV